MNLLIFSQRARFILMILGMYVSLLNAMNLMAANTSPDQPWRFRREAAVAKDSTGGVSKWKENSLDAEMKRDNSEVSPAANSETNSPTFEVRLARSAQLKPGDSSPLLTRLARSAASGKAPKSPDDGGSQQSVSEEVNNYDTEGRWLADAAFYDYQADAPVGGAVTQMDECPRVPEVLPSGACAVEECLSDRECRASGRQCCYNGCTYTCLDPLQPPPFIDWIREPRRRLKSGNSWLVPGPDDNEEIESCSTTPVEEDEDPLLCPHGYVCSIEHPGNPEKNIPNRGRCVREVDDSATFPVKEENPTPAPTEERHHPIGCKVGTTVVLETGRITLDGKVCVCRNLKLHCTELT